jgi:hypothetical protein
MLSLGYDNGVRGKTVLGFYDIITKPMTLFAEIMA